MAELSKKLVKLATELIKYYASKALGEGALDILAGSLADFFGESITEKISAFLDQGEKADQLLSAFKEADECFTKRIEDQILREAIISAPFAGLNKFEVLAENLPVTLDDQILVRAIKNQLALEWPGKFTDSQLDYAAKTYLDCLDHSLASKCDQLLPTIFRKIERIEDNTRKILNYQQGITTQIRDVDNKLESQNDLLLRLGGMTTGLIISSSQQSQPDVVPLQSSHYLTRRDFIDQLKNELKLGTWLALIDGPGKGKTQLAITIFQEFEDPFRCWISLRNQGDLASKHFREQIFRWLIQLTNQPDLWLAFIYGKIPYQNIIREIAGFIKHKGLLIIDDLPQSTSQPNLYQEIEITVKEFSNFGGKIISTGQWNLPPLLTVEPLSSLKIHSCPYFSSDDILILLGKTKIPDELKTEKIAFWIAAITKGHPSLVNATIKWLEQQGNHVSIATYDGLITGEPIKDVIGHNRTLLIKTLFPSYKELLYRLSLVNEALSRNLALNIAKIPPAVSNPAETLENLTGPWLDQLTNGSFEVSPLLINSGKDNIPFDVEKEVHLLVANQYLHKRIIDSSKANTILIHLWQAHEYVEFASILIQFLLAAKTREQAKYIDWACVLMYDVNWPNEISMGFRIMIRAAQVRTLALAGGKYRKINDDLEMLLTHADIEENAAAILFAYVNSGLVNENLPVEITIPRSFNLFHMIQNSTTLKREFSSDLLSILPNAVWAQGVRVKNCEEIKLFIQNFNNLSETDMNIFVEASFATEISTTLFDQSWYSEASKPQENRDWISVLKFLDESSNHPKIQQHLCFRVAIARAKAVVYADYLKQYAAAIGVLDALPQLNNLDMKFQTNYSKGCFASDAGMNQDAISFFTNAENTSGSGYIFYRLENTSRLAIEASKCNDWVSAKELFIKAIHQFKNSEGKDFFKWSRIQLLGELAYVYWANGDLSRAYGAMYGFVMALVNEKSVDDLRFREAFNKAGHGMGWFISMASTGKPPSVTQSGDAYTPVKPGLFGIRRESMGSYIPPAGFSKFVLLTQLAMFAEATCHWRTSWILYKRAHIQNKVDNNFDSLRSIMFYFDLASLEVIFGDPNEAINYTVQVKKMLALERMIGANKEILHTSFDGDIETKLQKVTTDDYQNAETRFLYVIFAPLFSELLASDLNTAQIISKLTQWERVVIDQKLNLSLSNEWLKVIRYFGDLIFYWKEGRPVDTSFKVFEDSTTFEIYRHLLMSDQQKINLRDAFRYQVSAIISIPQYGHFAKHMLPGIGRFVHRYWSEVAQHRRFALSHPELFVDELKVISPDRGGATLELVLKSAGQAIKISIPEEAKKKLTQVRKISVAWDPKLDQI
jgi:hypothetical protein